MGQKANRALRASLAVIIMATGSAAFIGLADAETGVPDSMSLPAARIGDRASYDLSLHDAPFEMLSDEVHLEWLGPEQIVTRDRGTAWSRPLAVERSGLDDGRPYLWFQRIDFAMDRDDVLRVLFENPGIYEDGQVIDGTGIAPVTQDSHWNRYLASGHYLNSLPCGAWGTLNGARHRLDAPVTLYGFCDPETRGESHAFQAIGIETVAGIEAVRFDMVDDPRVSVWLHPSLPFPVKVYAPLERIISDWDAGGAMDWTLIGFRPGGATYDAPATVQPAADILVPRTDWGLDDSDIDHPFPLSRAYAWAMLGTDVTGGNPLPDFLAEHPDAYLAIAWYNGAVQAGERWTHRWWFLVTDGDEYTAKNVQITEDELQEGLPDSVLAARAVTNARWTEHPDSVAGILPPPDKVPERLPSVAAVHELYRQHRSPHLDGIAPNRYSLNIHCEGDLCSQPASAIVTGGYYEYRGGGQSVGPLVLAPPGETGAVLDAPAYREGMIAVDGQGDMLWGFERIDDADLPDLRSAIRAEGTPEAVGSSTVAGGWEWPGAGALAAVGIGAAVLGALYYFWPQFGVGGFSRIERHKALEQPVRRRIYDLLEADPGAHFQGLARRLDVGRGALEHHLNKLVDTGLVTAASGNGYVCYFPKGSTDQALMAAWPFLKADAPKAILAAVAEGRADSCRDLATVLGMSPATISNHLRRLESAGVLENHAVGRRKVYGLTRVGTLARQALAS